MFGRKDEFEYLECADCGCVQICNVPENIRSYYPTDYYSYLSNTHIYKGNNILGRVYSSDREKSIRSKIADYYLVKKNLLGYLYDRKYRIVAGFPIWLRHNRLRLTKDSSILDVGCGIGRLIYELKEFFDFTQIIGIDPYISRDIEYDNGVCVFKSQIEELNGQYDVIMMHHSFEHMAHPQNILNKFYRLLKPQGRILIRIPLADSYAWRHYRTNWVQLDAPRHLYLHTLKSLSLLANRANLNIESIEYDSDEFQFWGSEQYKNNIPLVDAVSYGVSPDRSMFNMNQIHEYRQQAEVLNINQNGDQACIFLCRS